MLLRIASRKSDLARLQAQQVGEALLAAHPGLQVQYFYSESLGDKNLQDPLWKMPEKGVFTEDLTRDLLEDKADLVVHSWKDLPVQTHPETEIAATLEREDARDLLLLRRDQADTLSAGKELKILSSSPRREYNLSSLLPRLLPLQPQVRFESVRGNIPTRIRKLVEEKQADGLIVAKAALDRLLGSRSVEFEGVRQQLRQWLGRTRWMVLPLSQNPAAPAQGALAIEILRRRQDLKTWLKPIHRPEVFSAVQEERRVLSSYGGGCHQKIGATVLQREMGQILFLRGLTQAGEVLRSRGPLFESQVKPHLLRSSLFFEREALENLSWPSEASACLVSHSEAWRPGLLPRDVVVWTPGVKTWETLAQQGVWVSGCHEGLGESEDPRLDHLAPGLVWRKLTHDLQTEAEGPFLPLVTYRLKRKAVPGQIPPEGPLYWTSASLALEALERDSRLLQRENYCGPGRTWQVLRHRWPGMKILWPLEETK